MTHTIVLDLDDTLYLERDYVASGFAALSKWVHAHVGVEGFGETAWRIWESGERQQTFDHAFAGLGVAVEPGLIAQAIAVYRAHDPVISLQPDAERFLRLSGVFHLAMVTDGPAATQRAKIAALDLGRFGLDPIICTDDWGRAYWKPHHRAFEAIAAAHRELGGRFVYVADNPAKDFLAPRALGWRTVQIDRPGAVHPRLAPTEGHGADVQIRSFDDLTGAMLADLFEDRSLEDAL